MTDGIELVVEGRTFVQEPPTFEQEMFIMQLVMDSGFDKPELTVGFDPTIDDLTRAAKKAIVHAYKSGTLFDLLGALVTEKGTDWTPEQARANGELFKKTRDPKAKAQLHPALIAAVAAFFESAKSSEMTFPISSDVTGDVSLRPRKVARTSETEADRLFRSGNTIPSSEKSHSTRKSPLKKSSHGKSATG